MKYLLSLTLILLCLSWVSEAVAQEKKLYKRIELMERYYDDGNYRKSLEYAERFINNYKRKKLGIYVTQLEKYLAKYYLANGYAGKFEETAETYLKHKHKERNSKVSYNHGLLEVAKLYTQYGNLVEAEAHFDATSKHFNNKRPEDIYLRTLHFEVLTEIAFQRGNFDSFWSSSEELLNLQERFIAPQTLYFSEIESATILRETSKHQLKRAQNAYIITMLKQAQVATLQGNWEKAEDLIRGAESRIMQTVGKQSHAYIIFQYSDAKLRYAKGQNRAEIRRLLEQALYRAERKLSRVHHDYIQIHQTLIDYYQDAKFVEKENLKFPIIGTLSDFYVNNRYRRKNNLQRWELRQNTKRYFSKSRFPYSYAIEADIKQELRQNKSEQVVSQIETVLANTDLLPLKHPQRIALLKQAYWASIANFDTEGAEKYLQKLEEATKNIIGENNMAHFKVLRLKADYLSRYTAKFEEAGNLHHQLEAYYTDKFQTKATERLAATNEHALFFRLNDKYDSTNQILIDNLQAVEAAYGNKHIRYAYQLQREVEINMLKGDYRGIKDHINTILEIYEVQATPSLNEKYAEALEIAADYYLTLGAYSQARSLLQKASRIYARSSQGAVHEGNIERLAFLFIKMERYDEAQKLLEQTIEDRTKRFGENSRFLIGSYNQMARLQLIKGDLAATEDYARKALEGAKEFFGDKSMRTTESLRILSEKDLAIGNYESAKSYLQEEIDIKEKAFEGESATLAISYSLMARIKYFQGENWEEVLTAQNKAESIIENTLGTTNPIYAELLQSAAALYLDKGDLTVASQKLAIAQKIWIQVEAKTQVAAIDGLLGDIALREAKFETAENYYKKSQKAYRKIFGKDHPTYNQALGRMAKLDYTTNNQKRALRTSQQVISNSKDYIQRYFPVLSDNEKSSYWNVIKDDFEFFVNLAITQNTATTLGQLYDNTLLTKTVLLSASQRMRTAILNSENDSLIRNYERWIALKQELPRLLSLTPEQQKESDINIKKFEKDIEDLEKILTKQSSIFTAKEEEHTWRDVKNQLGKNEYAVEIIRFRHFDKVFTDSVRYAALIIHQNSRSPQLVEIPNGNHLEGRAVLYYRNAVDYKIRDTLSYHLYWEAIDEQIPDDAYIYLSADGVYRQINLETFGIGTDEDTYLIDKQPIALLTTTKDIDKELKVVDFTNITGELTLFGNPQFYREEGGNRKIADLPGTKREIEAISSIYGNATISSYTMSEAQEAAVRNLEQTKILHFATHGIFEADISASENSRLNSVNAFANPLLRSALLLTGAGDLMENASVYEYNRGDGILTAYEVQNLNLSKVELVVLSACETGRGENVGDGVYGLQRAFLIAGARNLIMSLFKVDDTATKELMRLFYNNLYNGLEVRAAFIDAKKKLREEYPEPIYWGAFIMIGQ
ncbi:MAG: CHAT domain-containing protein [Bernardetiaceae bacterium]|nr:CHAT domain-containing protein [Bernardetiaceae bacterium]